MLNMLNRKMKKVKYLFLLIVLTLVFVKASAQINPIKQFSEDPLKFLEEVKTMFEATSMDKKELKEYMEQFALVWNSPSYTENLKKSTYACCNLMVKKKIRILPEYKSYLNSVVNFAKSDQGEANFLSWQGCIDKILNAKTLKNYSDYLQMSENLFESNTFYKSSVVEYASNSNKYTFEFDSVPKEIGRASCRERV